MTYDKLPVSLINKYIWDLANGTVEGSAPLTDNVWNLTYWNSEAANTPVVPIFPVNENFGTGFTTSNTYVLYDYVVSGVTGTFWPIEKERVTYTIVGEIPKIYYAKNFIYENLRKFDSSAQEVNRHISDPEINFKYIRVDQPNFIAQEFRAADSQFPRYQTTLILTYEFTKS
jgi:hypothetical protein